MILKEAQAELAPPISEHTDPTFDALDLDDLLLDDPINDLDATNAESTQEVLNWTGIDINPTGAKISTKKRKKRASAAGGLACIYPDKYGP